MHGGEDRNEGSGRNQGWKKGADKKLERKVNRVGLPTSLEDCRRALIYIISL